MPIDFGVLSVVDKAAVPSSLAGQLGGTIYNWEAFEGDIQLNARRRFVEVSSTDKLAQGMFKIILTPLGSNPMDPNYGTNLLTSIGGNIDISKVADIQTEIINALTYYNSLNQDNPNSDEVIETIDTINVISGATDQTHQLDPRSISIQIGVTTESGIPVILQVPQINH